MLSNHEVEALASNILREQRTDKSIRYERLRKGYDAMRASKDPKHAATLKRWKEEFLDHTKAVGAGSVHSNTFLSSMSVMYANDDYIGERLVCLVPVGKRSDSYAIYPQRERFEFPDDSLGNRAKANEINESRSSDSYSVKDYGLSNYVAQDTLDNQDAIFDEMVDLVDACNEGVAFRRELRLASLLTTASNYSGNTVTLSGSNQWDSGTGGDPIKDIQTAISGCWMGQGATDLLGFCSLSVFIVLQRHPAILDNLKYQRTGLATRQEIANYFGLTDLLVSAARRQTANEGQTAAYSRIWGLDFGVVRVARRPTRRSAHFASIFRMNGDPVTTQWQDPAVGVNGGYYAKVAVREDLKIVAAPTGYLIKSCVANAV